MELDEFKKIWQQQKQGGEQEYSRQELSTLIDQKMSALEKDVKSRDRLEIIACIAVTVFFGIVMWYSHSLLIQLGSATIIISALYIWYRLKSAQIKSTRNFSSVDHSLEKHLKQEQEQVMRQRRLLKHVAWWYIGPPTIGLFLITLGSGAGWTFKIVYLAIVLVFDALVWHYNQKARRKNFEPLINEIDEAIGSIREEKPNE